MGLLTNAADPGSGPVKVLSKIRKWSSLFCVFLYLTGLVYFAALHWPSFHGKTYFSENALLPGLVDEEFMKSKTLSSYAKDAKKAIQSQGDKYSMPHDWLHRKFTEAGLESYTQNFSINLPVVGVKDLRGRNVYGILRAPRSSSSEAIVLCIPYRMNSHSLIGLLFTLAQFCRGQIYWAKDLIFVITEHESIGMEAWLSGYYQRRIPSLRAEPLLSRGGAIQAAVAVELDKPFGPYTHADLRFNMVNGQLPNLDLLNLIVRMVEKEALEPTLFRKEEPWDPFSYQGFLQLSRTSIRGLAAQAWGRPNGLHGVFGSYGIEAVTVEAYQKGKRRNSDYHIGLEEVARILEGALRSLNNLLERFHQSFFFYLLPSSHRYISIGSYMPAIGLMALAPLVKACCLWADMVDVDVTKENGKKEVEKEDHSFLSIAPLLVLVHIFGTCIYCFPSLFLAQQNGDAIVNGLAGIGLALFFFPFLLNRSYKKGGGLKQVPSPVLLRAVLLIVQGLVLGVVSVLNFGLGLFLCVLSVPVALIAQPSSNLFSRVIASLLLILLNPLVLVALLNLTQILLETEVMPSIFLLAVKTCELTKISVTGVLVDSFVHGSWLFALISLCLVPIWTLFWTLVHLQL